MLLKGETAVLYKAQAIVNLKPGSFPVSFDSGHKPGLKTPSRGYLLKTFKFSFTH